MTGFAATADANVSFDGKTVLFAGKQAANDPWQIWELTLADHSVRKLIAGDGDVIRPFYLAWRAAGLCAAHGAGISVGVARKMALATACADRCGGRSDGAAAYLCARQCDSGGCACRTDAFSLKPAFRWAAGSTPELFLVYSDGSGVESYRCDHGTGALGRKAVGVGRCGVHAWSDAGAVHFAAGARGAIAAPRAEYAGAIAETASGDWLVSARAGGRNALCAEAVEAGRGGAANGAGRERRGSGRAGSGCAAHQAQASSLRAARLGATPIMLALDARLSREGDLKVAPASVRLETLDADGQRSLRARRRLRRMAPFL